VKTSTEHTPGNHFGGSLCRTCDETGVTAGFNFKPPAGGEKGEMWRASKAKPIPYADTRMAS